MRIIAGTHRGTSLMAIGKGEPAAHLRPTSDRVRESIFSLLLAHHLPAGARVLDLFAGTGALGLEALSRGASHVTFVENGQTSLTILRANIAKLRREADSDVLRCDARCLPSATAPCALVFLDPPYGKDLGRVAVSRAEEMGWISPGAVIIWEEQTIAAPPAGFAALDHRQYGDTHITILRRL